MRWDECNEKDIFDFLKLLERMNQIDSTKYCLIEIEEWKIVMKRAKWLNTSSIFSKRNYSIYKCCLQSKKMISILVKYYNTIIKKEYYLKRWLQVLDVMLDKGKGLVLGKLRMIQLIKADL